MKRDVLREEATKKDEEKTEKGKAKQANKGKQTDEEWELVREKKTEGKKGRGGGRLETEGRIQDEIV